MTRTNLTPSAKPPAVGISTRRRLALAAVLLSTLAACALWIRNDAPQINISAPQPVVGAQVAAPAYSPAPSSPSAPPLAAARTTAAQKTTVKERRP